MEYALRSSDDIGPRPEVAAQPDAVDDPFREHVLVLLLLVCSLIVLLFFLVFIPIECIILVLLF